jgi:ABC-type phosphate transport system permease subunit
MMAPIDRRQKDLLTTLHQWATMVGVPLIVAGIIGIATFIVQIRDASRDHSAALTEIRTSLPKVTGQVADHETRIRIIEAQRGRPL